MLFHKLICLHYGKSRKTVTFIAYIMPLNALTITRLCSAAIPAYCLSGFFMIYQIAAADETAVWPTTSGAQTDEGQGFAFLPPMQVCQKDPCFMHSESS
jgi:hypothetical protein